MDYEKKYKRLTCVIKDLYPFMSDYCKEKVEGIIPELKESEDEKIRKEILDYLSERRIVERLTDTKVKEDWIAWLEKQGKQKSTKNIMNVWKDMRLEVYQQASGNRHEPNYSDDTTKMFSLNDIDEIIEKMSEQKPEDKVEPKFKVGDWITNGEYIWKVTGIGQLDYILQSQNGDTVDDTISYVDEYFHLWTIQDAEEDEYQINTILHGLDLKREIYRKEGNQVEEERYNTQYNWLKSLKSRFN